MVERQGAVQGAAWVAGYRKGLRMGSIGRGFRLVKASWGVIKTDRELLVLPVFSFALILVVAAVFALGAFGVGLPQRGRDPSPALYALAFVFYVATSFVAIFFNAAVIGTAMKRLQGREARMADGLALARKHLSAIFVWAVITATVGIILRALQERVPFLGSIVVGLLGVAWNVLTFFVVPVLLYEPVGVGGSIKRSASLFKQRWGEQFTGNATIGLVLFLAGVLVAGVAVALAMLVPVLGIVVGVLGILALAAVGSALSGVFNAALYRYATTGEASGAFTAEDLSASFRPRKRGMLGRS
jgi:hypothetical protein